MLPTNEGHAKRDVMCADPSPRLAEDQQLMHPQAREPGLFSIVPMGLGEAITVDRGLSCAMDGGASPKDAPRSLLSALVSSVDGSSELSGCRVICDPSGYKSYWPIGPATPRKWYPHPQRARDVFLIFSD